jgi:hypothetical protein
MNRIQQNELRLETGRPASGAGDLGGGRRQPASGAEAYTAPPRDRPIRIGRNRRWAGHRNRIFESTRLMIHRCTSQPKVSRFTNAALTVVGLHPRRGSDL